VAKVRRWAWLIGITTLLIPIFMMASGSFQDIQSLWGRPTLIPRTLMNYENLLSARGSAGGQLWQLGGPLLVPRWLLNTILLTTLATATSVITGAAAGYGMRDSRLSLLVVAATLIVPSGALLIPLFRVARMLGIQGTLLGAALPTLYWPLGILLYWAYIAHLPKGVLDAARLDGAGELTIFLKIVMPMTTPALGAMVFLKALEVLGDFVWQWIQLPDPLAQTLLVGLARMTILQGAGYGLPNPAGAQMAAGMLALVPVVVVFVMLKRFWKEGVKMGTVK